MNTETISVDDLEFGIPSRDLPLISSPEDKKKFKESRYFWPDGTKKHYCIKCSSGPYRRGDGKVHKFGEHMIICQECKEKYYTIKDNKKATKDYVEKVKDVIPFKIHNAHGV